jgi:hypothetical protein
MKSDKDRITAYIPLIDRKQRIECFPAIVGLPNAFEFIIANGTHLKLKNETTGKEYYVPFAMIEFISPSNGNGAVIRLRREMQCIGETTIV